MTMKTRAHVYVSGRVQGVFFRSETIQEATKQNVTGWIANLPDGKVEAVFEGEEQQVNKMIDFCRHGPPAARVTSIQVLQEPYSGKYTSFEAI
jgi:acylphosphatase